jgi:hypothetical protein
VLNQAYLSFIIRKYLAIWLDLNTNNLVFVLLVRVVCVVNDGIGTRLLCVFWFFELLDFFCGFGLFGNGPWLWESGIIVCN